MQSSKLALVLALYACGKGEAKQTPPPSDVAAAPAAAPGTVELFVDEASVAKVTPAQVGTWPRLDTLVPVTARRLGTWETVTLKSKQPKPTEVHKPSDTYPELVPALFPGEGGAPAFGMFDPVELAKHGKPALREDNLSELRIKLAQGQGRGEHESGQGGGNDPTEIKIAIHTPKGDSVLDGAKIIAIPRVAQPGDDSSDPKGWPLAKLLEAAGIAKFERISVADASGTNLTLEKADFDASSMPYVKLNRQGTLRLRVYKKQGDSWQVSGDLRGIASIDVVK